MKLPKLLSSKKKASEGDNSDEAQAQNQPPVLAQAKGDDSDLPPPLPDFDDTDQEGVEEEEIDENLSMGGNGNTPDTAGDDLPPNLPNTETQNTSEAGTPLSAPLTIKKATRRRKPASEEEPQANDTSKDSNPSPQDPDEVDMPEIPEIPNDGDSTDSVIRNDSNPKPPKGKKPNTKAKIEIIQSGEGSLPDMGVIPKASKLPKSTTLYLVFILLLNIATAALGLLGVLGIGVSAEMKALSFFTPLLILEAATSLVNLAAIGLLLRKNALGFWIYSASEIAQAVGLGVLSLPGLACISLLSLPLLILVACVGKEKGLIHQLFNPDGNKAIPSLSTPALILILGLIAGIGFLPNRSELKSESSKIIGLTSEYSDTTNVLNLKIQRDPIERLQFWKTEGQPKLTPQKGQMYLVDKDLGNLLIAAYPRGNNSGTEQELKSFREDTWWRKLYTHKSSPMKWGSNPTIAYEEMIRSPQRDVLYSVIQKPSDATSPFRHEAQWIEAGNGTIPVLVSLSFTTQEQNPDLGTSIELGKTALVDTIIAGLFVDGTQAADLPKP